jgi:hypothetical protein
MSYFNIVCDVCGRGVQGITWVNGMKFCAKCYQETFGASKDWQLLDKDKTIAEQQQRISELEEQLKNARKETAKKVIDRVEELSVFDFEAYEEMDFRRYIISEMALDNILKEYGENNG